MPAASGSIPASSIIAFLAESTVHGMENPYAP